MPILHKFQEYDFGGGFQSHNSILDVTPYEPEVLFIGTFNPAWPWNPADFYYGRDMYMWTAFANLFLYNHNHLIHRRNEENNNPNLPDILKICQKAKITFADIVKGTTPTTYIEINTVHKEITVNGNYIWNSYKDAAINTLGNNGFLDDNVDAIIKYINQKQSLKQIYFTSNPVNWLQTKEDLIRAGIRNDVNIGNIFTPTANGFNENLAPPFHERVSSLTHCWIWNNLPHAIPVNKPNFNILDHNWLIGKGVEILNF
jgi:hypothetical protein